MIKQLQQELNEHVYSDNNAEAVVALRNKPLAVLGSISASQLLEYLTDNDKIATIYDCANDSGHELQNICRGVLIAIESDKSIDLSSSGNSKTLGNFIPDIIDATQATEIIAKATTTTFPFANVTIQQLREARGQVNTKTLNGWSGQRFIKVTVEDLIVEPCRPVVTKDNDYYTNEVIRHDTTIRERGDGKSFIIDLSNKPNAGAPTSITVELGAANPFEIEWA